MPKTSPFRFLPAFLKKAKHSVVYMDLESNQEAVLEIIHRLQPMLTNLNAVEPVYNNVQFDMQYLNAIANQEPRRRLFSIPMGNINQAQAAEYVAQLTMVWQADKWVDFGMFRPLDKQLELGHALSQ